jgi:CheY-like chemotaxis protein
MIKEKLNVLLVDDDDINNYVSESIIKNIGAYKHIEKKINGKEAIEFINETLLRNDAGKNPNLILIDINMPVMDGMEFLQAFNKIKEKNNMIVYLMHTAPLTPAQNKIIKEVYLTGNIEKPLTKEKFSKILSAHF